MFNFLQEWLSGIFTTTWFTIGATPISLTRVLGLALILVLVWWIAKTIEHLVVWLAEANDSKSLNESSVYAISRISRYLIWFIGLILGLNLLASPWVAWH